MRFICFTCSSLSKSSDFLKNRIKLRMLESRNFMPVFIFPI